MLEKKQNQVWNTADENMVCIPPKKNKQIRTDLGFLSKCREVFFPSTFSLAEDLSQESNANTMDENNADRDVQHLNTDLTEYSC